MIDQMMQGFASSPAGQKAVQVLQSKGFTPEQVQDIMSHAGTAAASGLQKQTGGGADAVGLFNIFGGHSGREFLMGAVTGLLKGDGVVGSLEDGGMGALAGHMGEYLAPRLGVDPGTAGSITAVLTPFVGQYVHDHLGANHASALPSLGALGSFFGR